MQFIMLQTGIPAEIDILIKVNKMYPKHTLGCLFLSKNLNSNNWVFHTCNNHNKLLDKINRGEKASSLITIFYVIDPKTTYSINAFIAPKCINFNCSGAGGAYGDISAKIVKNHSKSNN